MEGVSNRSFYSDVVMIIQVGFGHEHIATPNKRFRRIPPGGRGGKEEDEGEKIESINTKSQL